MSLIVIMPDGKTFHVLFDIGAGAFASLVRAGLPWPDVIVCTHWHPDHLNRMEANSIQRALEGRIIPFVATQTTWDKLPGYERSRFQHIAVSPGTTHQVSTGIGGLNFDLDALDASDHCTGGLNYVATIGTFRFGALFDAKNWSAIPLDAVESLDLAVVEANSLRPLSIHTGHVSIPEDLVMLRALKNPPRLALLTHFGFEDILSDGSLVALLAGLAPDLNVRLAYKGMTIMNEYLPPRNPVAVLDAETNLPVGVREKAAVHAEGLLHGSCLILVRNEAGRIAVYERAAGQTHAGLLDLFGGHMSGVDSGDPRRTAIREASEEVLLITSDRLRVTIRDEWLVALSDSFALESTEPTNRERSTVFGLRVPDNIEILAQDELENQGVVQLSTRSYTLDELLTDFKASPKKFADGLRRVLDRVSTDQAFRTRVEQFLSAEG